MQLLSRELKPCISSIVPKMGHKTNL
ncbi:hypothetical protein KQQSB11_380148 [Klebsiella quasipneumoniae subsp. quasipneumoniae]|nr:hypothetical protein KQQSB11_380148 [Klebsiella quasipneumoniae subsp. quasipneumoniae]